jgi:hypothetical protein
MVQTVAHVTWSVLLNGVSLIAVTKYCDPATVLHVHHQQLKNLLRVL